VLEVGKNPVPMSLTDVPGAHIVVLAGSALQAVHHVVEMEFHLGHRIVPSGKPGVRQGGAEFRFGGSHHVRPERSRRRNHCHQANNKHHSHQSHPTRLPMVRHCLTRIDYLLTRIRIRWYPLAPSGSVPTSSRVWRAPVPSWARTRSVYSPGRSEEHTSELQSRFVIV